MKVKRFRVALKNQRINRVGIEQQTFYIFWRKIKVK